MVARLSRTRPTESKINSRCLLKFYDKRLLMATSLAASGRLGALRGRSDECGLHPDPRQGQARSLVLPGEAGIGKTGPPKYLTTSAGGEVSLRCHVPTFSGRGSVPGRAQAETKMELGTA